MRDNRGWTDFLSGSARPKPSARSTWLRRTERFGWATVLEQLIIEILRLKLSAAATARSKRSAIHLWRQRSFLSETIRPLRLLFAGTVRGRSRFLVNRALDIYGSAVCF